MMSFERQTVEICRELEMRFWVVGYTETSEAFEDPSTCACF